jgi:prepilin-type processing-associated H-X9-DG protein
LIELLVVIAIIAILIGLLLPAVQKVREAAARMRCQNNLKQLGVAIHSYHDANGFFPTGGMSDSPPFGTGGGWGSAWTVWILPYIEQANLFQRFVFAGQSGWGATNNSGASTGARIPVYLCPSSPVGDITAGPPPGGSNIQSNHYVAIAGAVPNTTIGFTESRINTSGTGAGCCTGGIASGGGIMPPGIPLIRMTSITDGTSNSIMVSEQNDFLFTANGTRVAWGTGIQNGWMIGWPRTQTPPSAGNGGDVRHFQMTTIRYAINQKRGWVDGGDCGGTGVCQNVGNNIPLNSAHTGGVNALFGDGSVKFLRDGVSLLTLSRLATRDDGGVLANDF